MTIYVDRPDRIFQLWAFRVGMGRLLLRSTKNEQFNIRVDVLFQNVQALQVPAVLMGLVVSDADDATTDRITRSTGLLAGDDCRFFALTGSGYAGYVVAGTVVGSEDCGEYYEPSRVWPETPAGHLE